MNLRITHSDIVRYVTNDQGYSPIDRMLTMSQPENYYGSDKQYLDLHGTAHQLADSLHAKEVNYRGSWQKRGGIGAFMMLARKFDRFAVDFQKYLDRDQPQGIATTRPFIEAWNRIEQAAAECNYDIFKTWDILESHKDGDMNDLEDLAGYLLHVINEMRTVRPRQEQARADRPLTPHEEALANCQDLDQIEDLNTEAVNDRPKILCPACRSGNLSHVDTKDDDRIQCNDCGNNFLVNSGVIHQPPAHGTWEETHPHNYPSAGEQCPFCNSTWLHTQHLTIYCRSCKRTSHNREVFRQMSKEWAMSYQDARRYWISRMPDGLAVEAAKEEPRRPKSLQDQPIIEERK
jgi:hypothetical protein